MNAGLGSNRHHQGYGRLFLWLGADLRLVDPSNPGVSLSYEVDQGLFFALSCLKVMICLAHAHVRTHPHTHILVHKPIHALAYIDTFICRHAREHACTHTRTRTRARTRAHPRAHTHGRTHTHPHTHTCHMLESTRGGGAGLLNNYVDAGEADFVADLSDADISRGACSHLTIDIV